MLLSNLRKRINDTSISKKLYFTIGFTALLVTIELCTLWFSITTLSAVRAYVNGEGLWSKAQKNAILSLKEYAYSYNEKDYLAFKEYLKVPYGDKSARKELLKNNPNYNYVRESFLIGKNHPEDIDGMIKLMRRFDKVSYLEKAFKAWTDAEPVLNDLEITGKKLNTLISNEASLLEIRPLLNEIDELNLKLTVLEDEFSFTLGEGARWLENIVLKLVLALSLTIGIFTVILSISINRNLKKGVDAIINGANAIRSGALKTRVPIYAKDEIGMLAVAFNEMTETLDNNIKDLKLIEANMLREKQRAEKSEKAKKRFLINMSHEIRTPMNGILGFARYLEKTEVNQDQLESIKMIIKSGDLLLTTLNDILDFSKIETGDIVFANLPLNIENTIKSVIKSTDYRSKRKDLEIISIVSNQIPEVLLGDNTRLNQILQSLISNAIKFTEKGTITISAIVLEEDDKYCTIEFGIKDTGIGIALDQQEKIFNLFEQVTDNMTRKFGGTGIGLSIVKQLIKLQNGEINVNSSPNQGAQFYFKLPFKKDVFSENIETQKEAKLTNENEGKGFKVLVVEDNLINQLLVIKLLQKKGYETKKADNGKIALDKILQEDFDIVLMDLQMPVMDGYEATMQIRSLNNYKREVPIIAMTAHTINGDREKCLAIGMDEYITKPYHATELYDKMQMLLKEKKYLNN